jgi:hypothetical protein
MSLEHDVTIIRNIFEEDEESMFKKATPEDISARRKLAVQKKLENNINKIKEKSTVNPDGSLTVYGDISINFIAELDSVKDLGLNFYRVNGDFDISNCRLKSLEGSPRIVKGEFDVGSNSLTSLEGGPEIVYGKYSCNNNKLSTLKGAPRLVGGDFNCTNNYELVDFSELKKIEIKGKLRIKKHSGFDITKDYLDYKFRGGISLESKMNESFNSDIMRFLRSATEQRRGLGYFGDLKFDQIKDEDVTILNDPVQVAKDYKAGKYPDDILIFLILKHKSDKMYVADQSSRYHIPDILFILGFRDDKEIYHYSRIYKGATSLSKAGIADIVVKIPKGKFSTTELKRKRRESQEGLNLSDEQISSGNRKRYAELLAIKRKDVDFSVVAKELLDYVTSLTYDVKSGKERLFLYKVKGKAEHYASPTQFEALSEFLKQIWGAIDSGFYDIRQTTSIPDSAEYYNKRLRLTTSALVAALGAIKNKVIDLSILHYI